MDLENISLVIEGELHMRFNKQSLLGGCKRDKRSEACLEEKVVDFGEVLRVDEQVEVIELAERKISVSLYGSGGAFVGKALDIILSKQISDLDKEAGEVDVAYRIALEEIVEARAYGRRERWSVWGIELVSQEREEVSLETELKEPFPIFYSLDERLKRTGGVWSR